MKAIKIHKRFRNGDCFHIMFVDYNMDAEFIEDEVMDWAESEGSGANYGYTVDWEETTNYEEIKKALLPEINDIDDKITRLNNRQHKFQMYLWELKREYENKNKETS